jgi:hypothetical protein
MGSENPQRGSVDNLKSQSVWIEHFDFARARKREMKDAALKQDVHPIQFGGSRLMPASACRYYLSIPLFRRSHRRPVQEELGILTDETMKSVALGVRATCTDIGPGDCFRY